MSSVVDSMPDASRLYIGEGVTIKGEISVPDTLVVCGSVEGDCDIDGPLTLAEGGRWKGILKATDIVVAGTVEGDVVARQRVEIAGTARVSGSLAGHSIAVAEGAVIEGEIKVMTGEAPLKFEEKRQA